MSPSARTASIACSRRSGAVWVRRICNRLRSGNVTILGVLVNKFHEQAFGYGKAYRYYRAGYGYGYGEEKKAAAE